MKLISPVTHIKFRTAAFGLLLLGCLLGNSFSFADQATNAELLRGVVVDSNGEPIADARVTSTSPALGASNGRYETSNDLLTDELGRFE